MGVSVSPQLPSGSSTPTERGRGKMSGYFPYEGKGEIGALTFPPPLAPMGRGMEGG